MMRIWRRSNQAPFSKSLVWPYGIDPTINHTRGQHSNHYTTDVVFSTNKFGSDTFYINDKSKPKYETKTSANSSYVCLWDIMTLDTSSKLLSDSKFWDRLLKFNGIPRPHILNRSYTYMCEVICFALHEINVQDLNIW